MFLDIQDSAGMESLGGKLARHCLPGVKIFLRGELGAGKTTLVRGFVRELGFQGAVKSPTYTLVEPYLFSGQPVYHFDLYRLNSPLELETIGLRDYFEPDAICLVEWPEKAAQALGVPDLQVEFEITEMGRRLRLAAKTPKGQPLLASLVPSP